MSDKIAHLKSRSRFGPFLRTTSALLIAGFLAQDVLYANPDIKEIAVHSPQTTVHSKIVQIPEEMGTVEEAFQSPVTGHQLFLIQDAHVNESAQRNVAKIIDQLIEKEKIKTVFLEAGTGDDSLSDMRLLADAKRRLDVSERFLRKGYIQGPDYLDINSDKKFQLWGVEDKKLYYEAVGLYHDLVKNRETANAFVDRIERALRSLKPRLFSPKLLDFDKKRQAYQENVYSLTDHFKTLSVAAHEHHISLLAYPNFLMLKEVQEKEAAIDFQKANEEQQELAESLPAEHVIEKVDVDNIRELTDFYAGVEEKFGVGSSEFGELKKYVSYLKAVQKIRHEGLLQELEDIEGQVYSALAVTDEEKTLVRVTYVQEVLGRLVNLKANSSDIRQIKQNPEKFTAIEVGGVLNRQFMLMQTHYEDAILLDQKYETAFEQAKKFYDLTEKRDEVFVKNILDKLQKENQNKAAFLAGGYHTENLKKLLREKNISYVSIIPRVLHETNTKRYEQLLLSGALSTVHGPRSTEEQMQLPKQILRASSLKKMINVLPAAEAVYGGVAVRQILTDALVGEGRRMKEEGRRTKELVGNLHPSSVSLLPAQAGARLAEEKRPVVGWAERIREFIREWMRDPDDRIAAIQKARTDQNVERFAKYGIRFNGNRPDLSEVPRTASWVMRKMRTPKKLQIVTHRDNIPDVELTLPIGLSPKISQQGTNSDAYLSLAKINGVEQPVIVKIHGVAVSDLGLHAAQINDQAGSGPHFYGVVRDASGKVIGYALQVVIGETTRASTLLGDRGKKLSRVATRIYNVTGIYIYKDVIVTDRGETILIDADDAFVNDPDKYQAFLAKQRTGAAVILRDTDMRTPHKISTDKKPDGARLADWSRMPGHPKGKPDIGFIQRLYDRFDLTGLLPGSGERYTISALSRSLVIQHELAEKIQSFGRRLKILSIGPGHGDFERALRVVGNTVVGVDLNAYNAKVSKSKGIFAIVSDAHHLAVASKQFDVALFSESIGHMVLDGAVQQAYAALRPGGHIVITSFEEPRAGQELKLYRDIAYVLYPGQQIKDALKNAGFVNVAEDQVSAARTHRRVPYYIFTAQKPVTNGVSSAGARLAHDGDLFGGVYDLDGNKEMLWKLANDLFLIYGDRELSPFHVVRDVSAGGFRVLVLKDEPTDSQALMLAFQKVAENTYKLAASAHMELHDGEVSDPFTKVHLKTDHFMQRSITLLLSEDAITSWASDPISDLEDPAIEMYERMRGDETLSVEFVDDHYIVKKAHKAEGARLSDKLADSIPYQSILKMIWSGVEKRSLESPSGGANAVYVDGVQASDTAAFSSALKVYLERKGRAVTVISDSRFAKKSAPADFWGTLRLAAKINWLRLKSLFRPNGDRWFLNEYLRLMYSPDDASALRTHLIAEPAGSLTLHQVVVNRSNTTDAATTVKPSSVVILEGPFASQIFGPIGYSDTETRILLDSPTSTNEPWKEALLRPTRSLQRYYQKYLNDYHAVIDISDRDRPKVTLVSGARLADLKKFVMGRLRSLDMAERRDSLFEFMSRPEYRPLIDEIMLLALFDPNSAIRKTVADIIGGQARKSGDPQIPMSTLLQHLVDPTISLEAFKTLPYSEAYSTYNPTLGRFHKRSALIWAIMDRLNLYPDDVKTLKDQLEKDVQSWTSGKEALLQQENLDDPWGDRALGADRELSLLEAMRSIVLRDRSQQIQLRPNGLYWLRDGVDAILGRTGNMDAARIVRAAIPSRFDDEIRSRLEGSRLAEAANKEFRYWTERAGYTIENGGWVWTLDGNFRLSWDPQTKTLKYSRPDSQTISIGNIADDPLIRLNFKRPLLWILEAHITLHLEQTVYDLLLQRAKVDQLRGTSPKGNIQFMIVGSGIRTSESIQPYGKIPGQVTYADEIRSLNPSLPEKLKAREPHPRHNVTAPLSYPDLLARLGEAARDIPSNTPLKVMVVGPGSIGEFSPMMNEVIWRLAGRKVEYTVLDYDQAVLTAALKPSFEPFHYPDIIINAGYMARDAFRDHLEYFKRRSKGVDLDAFSENVTIDTVRAYAQDVQDYGSNELDFIIATESLVYAFVNNENSFEVVARLIKALKPEGKILLGAADFLTLMYPAVPPEKLWRIGADPQTYMRMAREASAHLTQLSGVAVQVAFDNDTPEYIEIIKMPRSGARLADSGNVSVSFTQTDIQNLKFLLFDKSPANKQLALNRIREKLRPVAAQVSNGVRGYWDTVESGVLDKALLALFSLVVENALDLYLQEIDKKGAITDDFKVDLLYYEENGDLVIRVISNGVNSSEAETSAQKAALGSQRFGGERKAMPVIQDIEDFLGVSRRFLDRQDVDGRSGSIYEMRLSASGARLSSSPDLRPDTAQGISADKAIWSSWVSGSSTLKALFPQASVRVVPRREADRLWVKFTLPPIRDKIVKFVVAIGTYPDRDKEIRYVAMRPIRTLGGKPASELITNIVYWLKEKGYESVNFLVHGGEADLERSERFFTNTFSPYTQQGDQAISVLSPDPGSKAYKRIHIDLTKLPEIKILSKHRMRVIRGYLADIERLETETSRILSDRVLWLNDAEWSKFWSLRGERNKSLFTARSLAYRWGREDFARVLGFFERYVSVGELNSALSQLNALRQDASDEAMTALVQKIRDEILPALRERSQKAAMAVSPDNINKLMSADAELGDLIDSQSGARLAALIEDGPVRIYQSDPVPVLPRFPNRLYEGGFNEGAAWWSGEPARLDRYLASLRSEVKQRVSHGKILLQGTGRHMDETLLLINMFPDAEALIIADGSLENLKFIKNELEKMPNIPFSKITLYHTDFSAMPFPDGYFDLVYSNNTYNQELERFGLNSWIDEIKRTLSNSGVFLTGSSSGRHFSWKGFHIVWDKGHFLWRFLASKTTDIFTDEAINRTTPIQLHPGISRPDTDHKDQNIEFSENTRAGAIEKLKADPAQILDVVIVGGGIAGVSAALMARKAGYSVLLLEKGSLAQETSSRSTRVLHGNPRYLDLAWTDLMHVDAAGFIRNIRHVAGVLRVRNELIDRYPDLAQPVQFFIPSYLGDPRGLLKLKLGIMLYTVLGWAGWIGRFPPAYWTASSVSRIFPYLNDKGLIGGVFYNDALVHDAALVRRVAYEAHAMGATILTDAIVNTIGKIAPKDEAYQIVVTDRLASEGADLKVKARQVIDARGPDMLDGGALLRRQIKLDQGTHIVITKPEIVQGIESPLYIQIPGSRRLFFVIPQTAFGVRYLRIGTTDEEPEDSYPTPKEIRQIVEWFNKKFPGKQISAGDIQAADAGIRNIYVPQGATPDDPSQISREHKILRGRDGVIYMIGVKLTDGLRAGREAAALVAKILGPSQSPTVSQATRPTPPPSPLWDAANPNLESMLSHKVKYEALSDLSDFMFRHEGDIVFGPDPSRVDEISKILKRLLQKDEAWRLGQLERYHAETGRRMQGVRDWEKSASAVMGARLADMHVSKESIIDNLKTEGLPNRVIQNDAALTALVDWIHSPRWQTDSNNYKRTEVQRLFAGISKEETGTILRLINRTIVNKKYMQLIEERLGSSRILSHIQQFMKTHNIQIDEASTEKPDHIQFISRDESPDHPYAIRSVIIYVTPTIDRSTLVDHLLTQIALREVDQYFLSANKEADILSEKDLRELERYSTVIAGLLLIKRARLYDFPDELKKGLDETTMNAYLEIFSVPNEGEAYIRRVYQLLARSTALKDEARKYEKIFWAIPPRPGRGNTILDDLRINIRKAYSQTAPTAEDRDLYAYWLREYFKVIDLDETLPSGAVLKDEKLAIVSQFDFEAFSDPSNETERLVNEARFKAVLIAAIRQWGVLDSLPQAWEIRKAMEFEKVLAGLDMEFEIDPDDALVTRSQTAWDELEKNGFTRTEVVNYLNWHQLVSHGLRNPDVMNQLDFQFLYGVLFKASGANIQFQRDGMETVTVLLSEAPGIPNQNLRFGNVQGLQYVPNLHKKNDAVYIKIGNMDQIIDRRGILYDVDKRTRLRSGEMRWDLRPNRAGQGKAWTIAFKPGEEPDQPIQSGARLAESKLTKNEKVQYRLPKSMAGKDMLDKLRKNKIKMTQLSTETFISAEVVDVYEQGLTLVFLNSSGRRSLLAIKLKANSNNIIRMAEIRITKPLKLAAPIVVGSYVRYDQDSVGSVESIEDERAYVRSADGKLHDLALKKLRRLLTLYEAASSLKGMSAATVYKAYEKGLLTPLARVPSQRASEEKALFDVTMIESFHDRIKPPGLLSSSDMARLAGVTRSSLYSAMSAESPRIPADKVTEMMESEQRKTDGVWKEYWISPDRLGEVQSFFGVDMGSKIPLAEAAKKLKASPATFQKAAEDGRLKKITRRDVTRAGKTIHYFYIDRDRFNDWDSKWTQLRTKGDEQFHRRIKYHIIDILNRMDAGESVDDIALMFKQVSSSGARLSVSYLEAGTRVEELPSKSLSQSLEELLNAKAEELTALARKRLRSSGRSAEDIEDIVQDTFVRAYSSMDRYNPAMTLEEWFFGILKHTESDFSRKKSGRGPFAREENLPLIGDDHPTLIAPSEVVDQVNGSQERDILSRAIASLPDRLARVISLKISDPPHTDAEIGALIGGVSEGRVAQLYSVAKTKLVGLVGVDMVEGMQDSEKRRRERMLNDWIVALRKRASDVLSDPNVLFKLTRGHMYILDNFIHKRSKFHNTRLLVSKVLAFYDREHMPAASAHRHDILVSLAKKVASSGMQISDPKGLIRKASLVAERGPNVYETPGLAPRTLDLLETLLATHGVSEKVQTIQIRSIMSRGNISFRRKIHYVSIQRAGQKVIVLETTDLGPGGFEVRSIDGRKRLGFYDAGKADAKMEIIRDIEKYYPVSNRGFISVHTRRLYLGKHFKGQKVLVKLTSGKDLKEGSFDVLSSDGKTRLGHLDADTKKFIRVVPERKYLVSSRGGISVGGRNGRDHYIGIRYKGQKVTVQKDPELGPGSFQVRSIDGSKLLGRYDATKLNAKLESMDAVASATEKFYSVSDGRTQVYDHRLNLGRHLNGQKVLVRLTSGKNLKVGSFDVLSSDGTVLLGHFDADVKRFARISPHGQKKENSNSGARLADAATRIRSFMKSFVVGVALAAGPAQAQIEAPLDLRPETGRIEVAYISKTGRDIHATVGDVLEYRSGVSEARAQAQDPASGNAEFTTALRAHDMRIMTALEMIPQDKISNQSVLIYVDPKIMGEKGALKFAKAVDKSRANRFMKNVFFVLVRQEGDPLADTILNAVKNAGFRNVFMDSIPTDLKNVSRVNLWAADESFTPVEQRINLAVRPFTNENEEISDSAIFIAAYSGRVSWLRPSTEFLNALETVLKVRPTTDEVQRMFMGTLSISTWLKKYTFSFYIRPVEINLEQKALGARMAEQAA